MSPAPAIATAATFVWLGMVLAISFLETPLKFRAPGVTLKVGLGIGRLVFRALNLAEILLAVVLVVTMVLGQPPARILTSAVCLVVVLAVQVGLVRPGLNRRSDRILAGGDAPRSRGHLGYVALEAAKVVLLVLTGVLLLAD